MKKLSIILALIMVVLVLNAQITKVPVKVADLPKPIAENIAKNYVGFAIKDATKVTEKNVISYDVVINKGTTSETIVYDKDGKFLRKMTPLASTTPSTPPKK
jgi:hypothetical protein